MIILLMFIRMMYLPTPGMTHIIFKRTSSKDKAALSVSAKTIVALNWNRDHAIAPFEDQNNDVLQESPRSKSYIHPLGLHVTLLAREQELNLETLFS